MRTISNKDDNTNSLPPVPVPTGAGTGERAAAVGKSQRARDRVNKTCGIYLAPDICRTQELTPAQRILLSQIRQLDKKRKTGSVPVSNAFLAEACGLSLSTVKHAVPALVKDGWLDSEDHGYRVLKTEGARAKSGPDTTARQSAKAAPAGADMEPVGANSDPAGANLARPSKGRSDVTLNKTDMKAASPPESGSVIFKENHDNHPEQASPLTQGKVEAIGDFRAIVFMPWVLQTCAMMHETSWDKPNPDGTKTPKKLVVPLPGTASASDVEVLADIAASQWPRSDPAMALRQALRAAASTPDARETLQRKACAFGNGRLHARTVLTIGGNGDPSAFIRERCAEAPPPPEPPPAAPAADADADALIRICRFTGTRWDDPRWRQSWLEAAARARNLGYMPCGNLEYYAFCALDKADRVPAGVPFPWIIDSITGEDIVAFMPKYLADRRRAWTGGECRRSRDATKLADSYCPSIGRLVAEAAAVHVGIVRDMGKTCGAAGFRSRSCLLCAARDLEFDPELVKCVKQWEGTGKALAKVLRDLAKETPDDEVPIRGSSCGPGPEDGSRDSDLSSWIRCPYGNKKATYVPSRENVFKESERKPPNLT